METNQPRDGARRAGVGGLLTDPPLLDRITWRDPIRSSTLISEDRGLIARTCGTLFTLGGLAGWLLLAFGDRGDGSSDWLIAAMAATAIVLGALCFVLYRRLPRWVFPLAALFGTGLIAVSSTVASEGVEGLYALFYVWIAVVASLFFTPRMATVQISVAVGSFAAIMFARDVPFAVNYVIASVFVLGTSGVIIALLRARVEQLAAEAASQANTDPVTGIANRRGFNQRFDLEVTRTDRTEGPLSLIICDLDRFKSVNDALGHDQGDIALQAAAGAIVESVRGVDAVGRLGGEEFGVVLPGADEREAREVADRVRGGVRHVFRGHPIEVTASCGTATLDQDGESREQLMRAADDAMYEAKRRGRDRSVAYSEIAPQSRAASSTK